MLLFTHVTSQVTIVSNVYVVQASKGVQLVPKLETINVAESLKLPLNCIRGLQTKFQIEFVSADNIGK